MEADSSLRREEGGQTKLFVHIRRETGGQAANTESNAQRGRELFRIK